jgi:hypothetical protein
MKKSILKNALNICHNGLCIRKPLAMSLWRCAVTGPSEPEGAWSHMLGWHPDNAGAVREPPLLRSCKQAHGGSRAGRSTPPAAAWNQDTAWD